MKQLHITTCKREGYLIPLDTSIPVIKTAHIVKVEVIQENFPKETYTGMNHLIHAGETIELSIDGVLRVSGQEVFNLNEINKGKTIQ